MEELEKGLFITFEGGDGSGGTTQSKLLKKWMDDRGLPCILTKEPGSKHIKECQIIRELVLSPDNDLTARSELFLFLADRALHVEKLIQKNIDNGIHVISDRFADSTRVYQCVRGLSRQKVDSLIEFATDGLLPDLTILLDISPHIGLTRARLKSKYEGGDRMELENMSFHEEVRKEFLKLSNSIHNGNRFLTINTEISSIEETHKKIIEEVSRKLWL